MVAAGGGPNCRGAAGSGEGGGSELQSGGWVGGGGLTVDSWLGQGGGFLNTEWRLGRASCGKGLLWREVLQVGIVGAAVSRF